MMNMRSDSEREQAAKDWNKKADFYDDYRPNYPDELVAKIIGEANLIK